MGKDSKRAVINEAVEALEVRLIGADGQQVGVVKTTEALAMAQEESLDLVQIAGDSNPVVCKIMDYGKHLFDIKKKRAASRKKQKQTQVKEMKFRPGTEDGDYQVKLRNLTRFLEAGDKAKLRCVFAVEKWLTKSWVWSYLNEWRPTWPNWELSSNFLKWKADS